MPEMTDMDAWIAEGEIASSLAEERAMLLVVGDDASSAALVALGIARAQSAGRRVAIIDVTPDAAPLRELVTDDDPHGIVDTLLHGVSLARVSRQIDDAGHLFVVPTGTQPPDDTVMRHERWRRLRATFRETHALAVVVGTKDTPALDAFSSNADGVIVVGSHRRLSQLPNVLAKLPREAAAGAVAGAGAGADSMDDVGSPHTPGPIRAPLGTRATDAITQAPGAADRDDAPVTSPAAGAAAAAAAGTVSAAGTGRTEGAGTEPARAGSTADSRAAAGSDARRASADAAPDDASDSATRPRAPRMSPLGGDPRRPVAIVAIAAIVLLAIVWMWSRRGGSDEPNAPVAASASSGTTAREASGAVDTTGETVVDFRDRVRVANPGDSARATLYSVEIMSATTDESAWRFLVNSPAALPASSIAPVTLDPDTTRWFRVVAGAYTTSSRADSLLRAARAAGVMESGAGRVLRAPIALRVGDDLTAAAANQSVRSLRQRGIGAYALQQDNGRVHVYVGAFETPQQALYQAGQLRSDGVDTDIAYRTGRLF